MERIYIPELPEHIHDEKNGLDYTLHGDYYLPDLEFDPGYPLDKYGMARMDYLKNTGLVSIHGCCSAVGCLMICTRQMCRHSTCSTR